MKGIYILTLSTINKKINYNEKCYRWANKESLIHIHKHIKKRNCPCSWKSAIMDKRYRLSTARKSNCVHLSQIIIQTFQNVSFEYI